MAKTFEFTPLITLPLLSNVLSILNPNSELLVYTPLGLNVTARKYDSNGDATTEQADTNALLVGYNTTSVPPADLLPLLGGVPLLDILTKKGNSTSDSLRATSDNDIVYWDYATLFSLTTLSVPVGLAVAGRFNLPAADQNAAIEIFDLGTGNDILNLTHSNQQLFVSGVLFDAQAYAYAATAYGGAGNDVLWSGNQNDVLYGGDDNDRISGGGGDDTLYGGLGIDLLEGGGGHDLIFDSSDSSIIRGGDGNDTIGLNMTNGSFSLSGSADDGNAFDGNDKIVISGNYASSSFTMGGGNDVFIALNSTAASADRVSAGTGSDVVSTWSGNDDISGDDGDDVLWGGAGADTIYGGADNDLLYDGTGVDVVYGGAGRDLLYFSREDGAANQFYDLEREGLAPDGNPNAILVFGQWDFTEKTGDLMNDNQGVWETDSSIMDNDGNDMVYVHQLSGNIYRLEIVGGGITGASVDFDVRDVDYIILWDNAGVSGGYQQQYQWNDDTDTYARII